MSGPSVDTKGSTNTECMVFVHTHDRGPEHASQKIDLSAYITAVTINQHLTGGGSAIISLPAVAHIENIIAAGDLINIYFNTHRDDANAYNRGWVRTFFGYVSSVAKVVSVGGDGEKLTTYTVHAADFSKAVRNTQIYNNEHLASQGGNQKYGVIREDMSTNLGGTALLSQGIALKGTPRQIILQNIMRFLGFGGQFALPTSYVESLPNASHVFSPSAPGTKGKIEAINSFQAVTEAVQLDDNIQVKEDLIEAILELSKISDDKHSVSDLWDAIYRGDVPSNGWSAAAKVKKLQNKYRPLYFDIKDAESGKLYSQINNTFFKVMGTYEAAGIGFLGLAREVVGEEHGVKRDFETTLRLVLNEIESINPEALKEDISGFPKANLYAQKFPDERNDQPVRTIFNLLCFDYMEDVGGYWANAAMLAAQGSLLNALQKGSNHTMNEFFFDLRPSPEFKAADKDGLGVHLDGAIPMVPAVVLRRKPFTNYQKPNSEISNADIDGHLVIGGYKTGEMSPLSDQLVINSGGTLGAMDATAVSPSELSQVNKSLADVGGPKNQISNPEAVNEKTVVAPTPPRGASPVAPPPTQEEALAAWRQKMVEISRIALVDNVDKNNYIVEMLSQGSIAPTSEIISSYISAEVNSANVRIAKKALASIITLPRPIFRSPDKNRITKEIDIAQTQHILGYLQKDKDTDRTQFYAFGTGAKSGSGVKSSTVSYDVGLDPLSGGGGPQWGSFGSIIERDPSGDALLMEGSSMASINATIASKEALLKQKKINSEEAKEIDWHVLDYMTINPTDVMSENYTRGDFDVVNFLEYFGSSIGGFEAQRLFLGTVMPIVTPISVYRFGVRLFSENTDFVQALLSGATNHLFEKNIMLRWAILQDMWNQHNHELLSGSMSLRGMPGLRPGYRVDRLDTNLSFYVESVSHSWGHPGHLSTQITVSRGQPYGADNALRYERPTPSTPSYASERQALGKVFNTAKFKRGSNSWVGGQNDYELNTPGTYTGKASTGKQIKVEGRPENPWLSTFTDESLDE